MDRRPSTSPIPIQNIYYLLSYAWEKGQYSLGHNLLGIPGNSVDGLLARMLKEALAKIPSHSSSYVFQSTSTLYSGVKGKVDLARSLKQGLLAKGKTWVSYEKLVSDTLYLQIARSAWDDLSLTQTDPLPHILAPIAPIPLDVSLFQQARSRYPHRSIRYLMEICEWIHCHYLPSPTAKGNTMEGIILDPHLMPSLFESFIRNFYKQHAGNYSFVGRERLQWQERSPEKQGLLPQMETDVSLISPTRKIIVETKFYREALQSHYQSDTAKFRSPHLYQVFAYLTHSSPAPDGSLCEGLLIYPTVNYSISERTSLDGYPLQVCTLDLNRPWQEIHEELMGWV